MTTPQPPQPPQPLQVRRRTTRGETEMELSLDVPSDLEYVGPAVELIADELPGGPLPPPHPLQLPHRLRGSPRQCHCVRQPSRPGAPRARTGRGSARRRAAARDRRGQGVRSRRRPRSHAPRAPRARGRSGSVRAAEPRGPGGLQQERELGVPDAPGGLSRVERLLPVLERLVGARLRLRRSGEVGTAEGSTRLEPIPETEGFWLEIANGGPEKSLTPGASPGMAQELAQVVGSVLAAERDAVQVAAELSERYEEIDLIYTISEILGHTIRLDEAADRILREVSTVVGARRATLLVYDAEQQMLRIVAARGMTPQEVEPIEVDDTCSISARVFREMRIVSYDPTDPEAVNPGCPEGRTYLGKAFLSVPVLYAAPGARGKPTGVINLTDRVGGDAFTAGDRKLVAAIANQIGAAIENARLVARDLGQQRVLRELELARDLQLKLLPSPLVVASRVDVAARCRQAESVGGDFYNLLNLRADRIGVMIGDVTSHGFSAALIMALVMAASGIHAESA